MKNLLYTPNRKIDIIDCLKELMKEIQLISSVPRLPNGKFPLIMDKDFNIINEREFKYFLIEERNKLPLIYLTQTPTKISTKSYIELNKTVNFKMEFNE